MLLRCESLEPPMSQLGHTQPSRHVCVTSALPLTADIRRTDLDVGFVPQAAVSRCGNLPGQTTELFDHLVGAREQYRWHP